jgi:hypothetical protein
VERRLWTDRISREPLETVSGDPSPWRERRQALTSDTFRPRGATAVG